jgi:hypothetical protein
MNTKVEDFSMKTSTTSKTRLLGELMSEGEGVFGLQKHKGVTVVCGESVTFRNKEKLPTIAHLALHGSFQNHTHPRRK